MAQANDFLTVREFADLANLSRKPIPRDRDEAMLVLSDTSQEPNWLPPLPTAGATYESLSFVHRSQVDELAQQYADDRIRPDVDFAIYELSQLTKREMLDRFKGGIDGIRAVPPNYANGVVRIWEQDFNRWASFADDNVYACQYHVKDNDARIPSGHIEASDLQWYADPNFKKKRMVIFPVSGEWPSDMDLNNYVYFNYWTGVTVTDKKFPQYRKCVRIIAKKVRGVDGEPQPYELTVKRILHM